MCVSVLVPYNTETNNNSFVPPSLTTNMVGQGKVRNVLLVLCMTLSLLLVSAEDAWMTDYQQEFQFACDDRSWLTGIKSEHDNGQEDRRWNFTCSHSTTNYFSTDCAWTGKI